MVAACVLIFATLGAVDAGVNTWSDIGPFGGEIRSIAFGPGTASPPTYALTRSGLYRSADSGQDWTRVGGVHEPQYLVPHPAEANLVFALLSGNLHSSNDAGATFKAVTSSATLPDFDSLQVSADGGILYAVADRVVYRSVNRGVDWQAGAAMPASVNSEPIVAVDPVDALHLIAHAGNAVFTSANGGATWTSWNTPPDYVQSFAFGAGARRWVGTATGLYFSDNDGASYTATPITGFIRGIGVSPADATVVYATAGDRIHRTTNNGAQWSLGGGSVGLQEGRQFAFDPSSPGRVLLASQTGVWGSTDGNEWSRLNHGILATTISHLTVSKSSDRAFFAVGTQLYTLQPGAAGAVAHNPAELRMVFPQAADISTLFASGGLFAGSSSGGLARVDETGQGWSLITDPYIVAPVVTRALDGATGVLLAATSDGVLRSIDGGQYWSRTTGIPLGTAMEKVKLGSGSVAWASNYANVFRSLDTGVTWTQLDTSAITGGVYDLALGTPSTDVAYISSVNDVFRTKDGGSSWERMTALSGGADVPRVLEEGKNIFVASGGIVRHSSDGGSTWRLLPQPDGVTMWSGLRMQQRVLLAATYERGLKALTPASDVSIAISGAPSAPPAVGNRVPFDITVTNAGPYEVTNIDVVLAITSHSFVSPGGEADCAKTSGPAPETRSVRCSFGTLAPGASKTLRISSTYETGENIDISGTVTPLLQGDANASNNTTRIVVGYVAPPVTGGGTGGGGGGSMSLPWLVALLSLGALGRLRGRPSN